VAVEQVLREYAGEAVGAAGGRGFHGLVETGDEGSENLVEFRRLKTVGAGAAQFLFADGERGGPLRGRGGDGQVGFAHDLERFAGLGAGAEEPGLLFFGQLGEASIEHREPDLAGRGLSRLAAVSGSAPASVRERIEMRVFGISASEKNRRARRRFLRFRRAKDRAGRGRARRDR
jgi:hypothetical protein